MQLCFTKTIFIYNFRTTHPKVFRLGGRIGSFGNNFFAEFYGLVLSMGSMVTYFALFQKTEVKSFAPHSLTHLQSSFQVVSQFQFNRF